MQFLKDRRYTSVSTSIWYDSNCTILDALYLQRLNLERLIKSESQ